MWPRCLNCFSILGHSQQWISFRYQIKFAKVGSKFYHKPHKPCKNMPKTFKFLQKWRNFATSSHTGCGGGQHSHPETRTKRVQILLLASKSSFYICWTQRRKWMKRGRGGVAHFWGHLQSLVETDMTWHASKTLVVGGSIPSPGQILKRPISGTEHNRFSFTERRR